MPRRAVQDSEDPPKTIFSRLRRPESCAPETYQELIRTPRMQQRLLALGLVKKPVSERERRREERLGTGAEWLHGKEAPLPKLTEREP